MDKTFVRRLLELEALEQARQGLCRGYVVLTDDGEMVEACTCGSDAPHKAYVVVSPDDWDPDVA